MLIAGATPALAQVPAVQQQVPTRDEITRPVAPPPQPASRLRVEGGLERAPCPLADPQYAAIRVTIRSVRFNNLRLEDEGAVTPSYARFVGAGARTVVASHWPVPDDYEATKRLVLGTIGAPAGTPLATAMRRAEVALMDQPQTSHPFYWAAFALVGDGAWIVTR